MSSSSATPKAAVETCTIKLLPQEQWISSAARAVEINPLNAPAVSVLRQAMAGAATPPPEHLALLTSKYWGQGGVRLTVGFLDSPPADLRARIISHMNAWNATANVQFVETASNPQVRIARTSGSGYWSYLGTDILTIGANQPTMNLDSFTMNTPESEFHRVVRHETGHTLGFPHEHMRSQIVDRIDREKAITYFMATQGWSRDQVIAQVLTPLDNSALIATATADPASIMCYWLPASIMKDGIAVNGGPDIDAMDAQFAAAVYPKQNLVIGNFGYNAGGWRVEMHPRFLADLTGDGRADVVGFGNAGVWASLNNGNGTFQNPQLVVGNFGYNAGGWRVDMHPRLLADLTGDGRDDIVGFGNAGVWASLNNGNGTFQNPQLVVDNFGYNAGGWRVDMHPRFLADLTGDHRADIVGFGNAGVWVSLNNGNGTFQSPQLVVGNFGYNAGGWRVEHPRFLADLTGDGRADIVGFGNAGVWVSLNNGNGTFQNPQLVVSNFGYSAGGWRVNMHPRFLADLTGDGRADIVGFGNAGVWVSLNNGNGTFQNPQLVISNFGYNAGGWRVDMHPRLLADWNGDGRADVIGFGNDGVWVSLNNGNGTFQQPQLVIPNLGYNAGGWRVNMHPRMLADLTGDHRDDVVGFGNAGVYAYLSPL